MPDYNETLRGITDEFDAAHSSWSTNPDLTTEARRRGVVGCVDRAEDLLAADDRAFGTALEEERTRLTGQLEAAQEQHAPKHGPNAVASMMAAQAAVSSNDARIIMDAHEAAHRTEDHAALSILETAGPAAMPDALRKDFKDRIKEAQESRKPAAVKERETTLAAFEADAERAAYTRSLMRDAFTKKLREYKRPGGMS